MNLFNVDSAKSKCEGINCANPKIRFLYHRGNQSVYKSCFSCFANRAVKKEIYKILVEGDYEEFRKHRDDYYKKEHEQRLAELVSKESERIRSLSEDDFYNSNQWRSVRWECLRKHGFCCLGCGRSPPEIVIHVDHIKSRSIYPELALDINNLQPLCRDCNLGKSNRDETDFRTDRTSHEHS